MFLKYGTFFHLEYSILEPKVLVVYSNEIIESVSKMLSMKKSLSMPDQDFALGVVLSENNVLFVDPGYG
jgi:hypothetical protein